MELHALQSFVKEQGGRWSWASIREVKLLEADVKKAMDEGRLTDTKISVFIELRMNYNRSMAYQINQLADVKQVALAAGYAEKGSTAKWVRLEKGSSVLTVTSENTLKDLKTNEAINVFTLVNREFPKEQGVSDTAHLINTFVQRPEWDRPIAAQVGLRQTERSAIAQGVKTGKVNVRFNPAEWRTQPLDMERNYLLSRKIARDTLEHPYFKGAILHGNKAALPRHYNNIIYPFKTDPQQQGMSTLLQQFGKKALINGELVDKMFAAGEGRQSSAWFSNPLARVERLYVFENPLDALSHYQLYQPQNALYMATGGRPTAEQLRLMDTVSEGYGVRCKVLAFDNDMPGHRFDALYLADKYPQRYGVAVIANSHEQAFVVEFKNVTPTQRSSLLASARAFCQRQEAGSAAAGLEVSAGESSATVRCSMPKAAEFCNRRAMDMFGSDPTLLIEKSICKDFNDDLKIGVKSGAFKSLKAVDISNAISF